MPDLENPNIEYSKKIKALESQIFFLQHQPVNNSLLKILNNIDAIIYVTGIEDSKIRYTNKFAQEIFGIPGTEPCWTFFKDSTTECECHFCSLKNLKLLKNKTYIFEFKHPYNNRWYKAYDQIITWTDNTQVLLKIAYDITDFKKDERKLFQLLSLNKLALEVSDFLNQTEASAPNIYNLLKIISNKFSSEDLFFLETTQNVLYKQKHSEKQEKLLLKPSDNNILLELRKIINTKQILVSHRFKTDYPNLAETIFFGLQPEKLIIVPIKNNTQIIGYLGASKSENTENWTISEINLFQTIAPLLSNTYQKYDALQKLKLNQIELQTTNAEKDKLFSIIAHDLRSPIGSIISLASHIHENFEEWDSDQLKKFIELVKENSMQGLNLLENLLNWARSKTSQLKIIKEKTSINSLMTNLVNLYKPICINKEIKIILDTTNDFLFDTDKNILTVVLRNIISNAIKFTPRKGTITIHAKQSKKETIIEIKDTGIGIDPEKLDKLFSFDNNISSPGTENEKGTGLGLLLCKEYIEKLGGRIKVKSTPKKGSVFTIIL